MGRCIFLALCHDIAESVRDIPTYAGVTKGKYTSSRSSNPD